ncbi:hypothetical protein E2C01_071547 [Portunus trituberculatus]|uniref:Uncharacterized protein n=1 Tax=Portunus trituberculatus TaxID=210409 RepID=A0A5B7I078_PORTR|nr:hypothetical protein [Portunus trituberculatus]
MKQDQHASTPHPRNASSANRKVSGTAGLRSGNFSASRAAPKLFGNQVKGPPSRLQNGGTR